MKNFFQIADNVDVLPLLFQIQRQPDLWKVDTYLRDYPQGPFEDVETIFLRFPTASVTELEQSKKDQHECVWMDGSIHLPAARSIVFGLMNRMEGERLGRVMINKIRPGGRIFPHADTPAHADYWERFHCVLQSKPGVTFRTGDETRYWPTGSLFWFDNSQEHEVVNNSGEDRVHMIIDIRCSPVALQGVTPKTL